MLGLNRRSGLGVTCDRIRLARLNLVTSFRWRERSREEGIQLVVLRQTELPQRRHVNHPTHELFHGQEFIDVLQYLGVSGFLGISFGIRINVFQLVLVPDFL